MSRSCKWNTVIIIDNRNTVPKKLRELSGEYASYFRKKFKKLLDIEKDIIIETDDDYSEVLETLTNLNK